MCPDTDAIYKIVRRDSGTPSITSPVRTPKSCSSTPPYDKYVEITYCIYDATKDGKDPYVTPYTLRCEWFSSFGTSLRVHRGTCEAINT